MSSRPAPLVIATLMAMSLAGCDDIRPPRTAFRDKPAGKSVV